MSIMVDAEFKALIPPLSPEEYAQLEENCVREGIRDPLVVWATPSGTQILVDGHNRMKIAAEHGGMHFDVIEKKFDTRADAKKWIIDNQLGRRNLPTIDGIALRAERERILAEEARRRTGGGDRKSTEYKKTVSKNSCGPINHRENRTDYKVAKEIGISEDTYRKGKAIIEHGDKDVIDAVRVGDFSINKAYNVIHGYDKTPAQRQKEFMDSMQKEHEDFKEQKKEAVVSLADARKDESRQRILALDYYDRCLKVCKAVLALDVDIREGTIDLRLMSSNIEDGQRTELARRFMLCRQILDKIEQEVKG